MKTKPLRIEVENTAEGKVFVWLTRGWDRSTTIEIGAGNNLTDAVKDLRVGVWNAINGANRWEGR